MIEVHYWSRRWTRSTLLTYNNGWLKLAADMKMQYNIAWRQSTKDSHQANAQQEEATLQ